LFGALLQTKKPINILYGYILGSSLVLIAASIEWVFGIDSEGKSLEVIAPPLSSKEQIMATKKGDVLLNNQEENQGE
jgi:MFS superfamily sulfate permease-like transporter